MPISGIDIPWNFISACFMRIVPALATTRDDKAGEGKK